MKKSIVKIAIIPIVIALVLMLGHILLVKYNRNENAMAVAAAKEYLEKNYEQKMVFEEVTKSTEGSWSIWFTKKNNRDFRFKLNVSKNKETKEFQVWRDDYIKALIEYELYTKYKSMMEQIWNGNVRVIITYQIYTKYLTFLNEHSTLNDIQADDLNKKYDISIHIPYYFEEIEKDIEVEKIYSFIKTLQEDDYTPSSIMVYRLSDKNGDSNDRSKEEYCRILNIDNIESIEQLYDYIERNWFKEHEL